MRFVPMPVITGFTAGIAVIIASSQVGDFLGLRAGNVPVEFVEKWVAYGARPRHRERRRAGRRRSARCF